MSGFDGLDLIISGAEYATADQVYAAKPWLRAGSVVRSGSVWEAVDEDSGERVIAGRVPAAVLRAEASNPSFAESVTGFMNDTSLGDDLINIKGSGLFPGPGLGLLGDGKFPWWIWAIAIGAVIVVVSRK